MPFRSAFARDLDFKRASNVAVVGLSLLSAAIGLLLYLSGEPATILLAPGHVFLMWALVREIDPDHDWTALVAGALAGAWALQADSVMSLLVLGGLMVSARIVSSTTGIRPTNLDMAVVALGGTAIGFSLWGWIAGFGIAVALYLDDRLAAEGRTAQVLASAATALGTTLVAGFTGVFPMEPGGLNPLAVAGAGAVGLLLVLREPAEPSSVTDWDRDVTVSKLRLHTSRSLVAILLFALALFSGPDAAGLVPLIAAGTLAIVSNEAGRVRSGAG